MFLYVSSFIDIKEIIFFFLNMSINLEKNFHYSSSVAETKLDLSKICSTKLFPFSISLKTSPF